MATVTNIRDGAISFDLTIPENLAEVSVDGVSQALLGFPVSKMLFHVQLPAIDGVEQRRAVLNLNIGTLALLQICQHTLQSISGNSSKIDAAVLEYQTQFKAILQSIKVEDAGK